MVTISSFLFLYYEKCAIYSCTVHSTLLPWCDVFFLWFIWCSHISPTFFCILENCRPSGSIRTAGFSDRFTFMSRILFIYVLAVEITCLNVVCRLRHAWLRLLTWLTCSVEQNLAFRSDHVASLQPSFKKSIGGQPVVLKRKENSPLVLSWWLLSVASWLVTETGF